MDADAQLFDVKINELKDKFISVLDDFKKYYVYYNKNPEADEYANFYVSSKGNLQTLNNDIYLVTNSIQTKIEELDENNKDLNKEISIIKQKYKVLLTKKHALEHTEDGSEILINDTKEEYNLQYRRNLLLFLGSLVIIGISYKTVKKE
jgi:FtsZ-binding cell division protein ZapB